MTIISHTIIKARRRKPPACISVYVAKKIAQHRVIVTVMETSLKMQGTPAGNTCEWAGYALLAANRRPDAKPSPLPTPPAAGA